MNKKVIFAELNGNKIDQTVRCQFCGSEMRQGGTRMGSGVNTLTYWCDCGANVLFSRLYGKKIKHMETKYVFEE